MAKTTAKTKGKAKGNARGKAMGMSLHIGLNTVSGGAYGAWTGPLAACEADKRGRTGLSERPYPQGDYLRACFAAARTSNARPFDEQGQEGEAIGQAVTRARVAAVAEVEKPGTPCKKRDASRPAARVPLVTQREGVRPPASTQNFQPRRV